MAGSKTGSPTVIALARHICRVANRYGLSDLATKATPEFASAITALVAACAAFEALDDYPGQIDSSTPIRPGEDI